MEYQVYLWPVFSVELSGIVLIFSSTYLLVNAVLLVTLIGVNHS